MMTAAPVVTELSIAGWRTICVAFVAATTRLVWGVMVHRCRARSLIDAESAMETMNRALDAMESSPARPRWTRAAFAMEMAARASAVTGYSSAGYRTTPAVCVEERMPTVIVALPTAHSTWTFVGSAGAMIQLAEAAMESSGASCGTISVGFVVGSARRAQHPLWCSFSHHCHVPWM